MAGLVATVPSALQQMPTIANAECMLAAFMATVATVLIQKHVGDIIGPCADHCTSGTKDVGHQRKLQLVVPEQKMPVAPGPYQKVSISIY